MGHARREVSRAWTSNAPADRHLEQRRGFLRKSSARAPHALYVQIANVCTPRGGAPAGATAVDGTQTSDLN